MSDYKLTLEGNDNVIYSREDDTIWNEESSYNVLGFLNRSKTDIPVFYGDFIDRPGSFYLPRLQQEYDINTKPVVCENNLYSNIEKDGNILTLDEKMQKEFFDNELLILPEIKVIEQF